VVEDEASIRRFLATVLAQRGYDVQGAEDAEVALELHQHKPFDILIVDVNLPGMYGTELCRRVREMPGGEEPIIICVTGHSSHDILATVLDAGASDFLTKPLRITWLETRLVIAERRLAEARRRREAEHALSITERRYETVARHTPGLIFEIVDGEDGSLTFNYVSEGAKELLGISPAVLVEDPTCLLDVIHAEDRPQFEASRRAAAKTGSPWDWEGRTIRRFGHQWLQCTARPYRTTQGELVWDGIFIDVTERVVVTRAIRESKERLSTVLDSIGDGVVSTSTTGHITTLNAVAERILGYRLEEVHGRHIADIVQLVDEATERVRQLPIDEVARRLEPVPIEPGGLAVRKRGGELNPVTARLAPMHHDGEVSGLVLVLRDLSEARRVKAALQQVQRDFKQVIEHVPDGVAIYREGSLIYANPAFVRSLKHDSAEALIGRSLVDLIEAQDREPITAWLLGPHDQTTMAVREARFRTRIGGRVTLEISIPQAIRFEDTPATLVVSRDITERREMQAQLLLADRLVSVGTLAAGITHEINNPLSYVIANLRYLSEEIEALHPVMVPEQIEDMASLIDSAQRGAMRVATIVNDVRTFSRVDDNSVAPIDVRRVLDLSLGMAANSIRQKAVVHKDYGVTPYVEANEAQLGQVFLNLVINAAQAIPEDAVPGEIRLRTFTTPEGRVAVEVEDTGEGMTEAVRSRIFDPFFTTKPVGVGTGLGLSICHGIVVSMGGTIEVESREGPGTCFRVTLPALDARFVETPPGATSPDESTVARAEVVGRRILVIDDEPDVADVFVRGLPAHSVLTVNSGRDAITAIESNDLFDIVFCDLIMPEPSGIDVFERVSATHPELSDRFIFMTGGAFTPRARELVSRFPQRTIRKPFDLDLITRLVESGVEAGPLP